MAGCQNSTVDRAQDTRHSRGNILDTIAPWPDWRTVSATAGNFAKDPVSVTFVRRAGDQPREKSRLQKASLDPSHYGTERGGGRGRGRRHGPAHPGQFETLAHHRLAGISAASHYNPPDLGLGIRDLHAMGVPLLDDPRTAFRLFHPNNTAPFPFAQHRRQHRTPSSFSRHRHCHA